MTAVLAFTVGALIGAAVAINACVALDDSLAAFFTSCDESLAVLEDM
jgi:hypothetical protein